MKNKGITLIALVITIIVLLILAGVSISLFVGENSVLNQAIKSKMETEIAKEKESIGIAYSGLKSDVISGNESKINITKLEEEIEKLYNNGEVTVSEGAIIIKVKFEATQREYILDKDGNILEKLPIEEILATASKHPEQTLTEDIGVAEDGTQVNLDLWIYRLSPDNTYKLEGYGSIPFSGYDNENIVNGEIQGQVPMYIKEDDGEFYEVSYVSFINCENLVKAPEIPNSVTSMSSTFSGCTNLIKAPVIPDSIEEMKYTFLNCSKLTGVLKINATPTSYTSCFTNASTAEGTNLILVGNGTNDEIITDLYNTKSENSNITIGNVEEYENLKIAQKHPEQKLTNDIGVAEDGTAVNLDLWNYTLKDGYYALGDFYMTGYANEDLIDGKIQGKVPKYIKEEDGEVYTVNYVSFYMCTNLVETPYLPNSVNNMSCAFTGCVNLKTVINIPKNVEGMYITFAECTNLIMVPEIPDSVENMFSTFYGCTNLTGTLKINATPTSYTSCFTNASTAEGTNLVLVGNGTNDEAITNLYNTKSENSNITIGN